MSTSQRQRNGIAFICFDHPLYLQQHIDHKKVYFSKTTKRAWIWRKLILSYCS